MWMKRVGESLMSLKVFDLMMFPTAQLSRTTLLFIICTNPLITMHCLTLIAWNCVKRVRQ